MQKKVILNILKANKPIGFKTCIISGNHDQLYAHKFHGNPVNILLLKKSTNERELQNKSIEIKLFLIKIPEIKVANPKNKPKNKGIPIKDIGIKYLKLSSNVSEYVIQ